jgi:hypothetical protein
MTARLIRELDEDLHVRTIQDLATISGAHAGKIIDGRQWRSKAQAWVAAHPSPEAECEVQKLRAENEDFRKRLAALEKGTKPPKASPARLVGHWPAREAARKTAKKSVVTAEPIVPVVYD